MYLPHGHDSGAARYPLVIVADGREWRESGELAVHRAIRDRLQGSRRAGAARLPRAVAVLLPQLEESER